MGKYKEREPLTPEIVRTFEGFENTSEEEASEAIYTIDALCRITFEYLQHINRPEAIHEDGIDAPKENPKKRGRKKHLVEKSKDAYEQSTLCYSVALKNLTPKKIGS